MTWLLGGGLSAAVVGVVTLAIYMIKMARGNRDDLHTLLQTQTALEIEKARYAKLMDAYEEIDGAFQAAEAARGREEQARRLAEVALDRVQRTLAKNMSASGVVSDIRGTLKRLSQMSAMSKAATAAGRENRRSVHGTAAPRSGEPGRAHGDPGSGQSDGSE